MRAQASGVAERAPRRLGRSGPAVVSRRGELAAALAAAVLVVELALAPFTFVLTGCLVAIGRLGRWHLRWLAWPAAAALTWILIIGPAGAAANFAAWPRWLASWLAPLVDHRPDAAATQGAAALVRSPSAAAFAAALIHRLPGQLPIALAVAVVQAALVLWLGWRGHRAAGLVRYRPGLLAWAKLRWNTARLAAGEAVTRDGWALGVQLGTGRLVGPAWAQAAHGVLLTGQDGKVLGQLALTGVSAAIRRRKTVLIVDPAGWAAQVRELAGAHGLPVTAVTFADGSGQHNDVAALFGLAIRGRGVVLVSSPGSDRLGQSRAAASGTVGAQVVAHLVEVLASLRDLRLRADCLVWVGGCEHIAPSSLAELIELGPATGTAVQLTTTGAASLGEFADVIVDARGDGRFTMTGSRGSRALTDCRLVPCTDAGRP
jgi:hypothetical protein